MASVISNIKCAVHIKIIIWSNNKKRKQKCFPYKFVTYTHL